MVYHSKNAYLLIGKETNWGSAVSPTKDIGLVQSITPTSRNNSVKAFSLGSRNANEIVTGKFDVGLDMEFQFQHGRMLEFAIGNVAHAETTGDWKHTFTEANETPSFTLEDGFNGTTDVVLTYAGCKIVNTTISLALDGILTQKLTGVAKTVATGTSAGTAIVSLLPVFHSLTGTVEINTIAKEKVQNFDITINNNTEVVFGLGSRFGQQCHDKNREYEISFSIGFANLIDYNEFLGQSGSPATANVPDVTIEFSANNEITLGSGRREFYVKFTDAKIEEVGVPVKVGEFIFADYRATAKSLNSCFSIDNISDTNW